MSISTNSQEGIRMGLQSESLQSPSDVTCELTPSEKKIIQLLASGLQRKEIAQQLNISISTVKFHLENVYRKLGVHNQAGAVAKFLMDSVVTGDGKSS